MSFINLPFKNGIYKETTDITLLDIKLFQYFLYRNFKDYKNMRPFSNCAPRFYASAKTNKFDNINIMLHMPYIII